MVSLDSPEENREFAESLGAELTLLSDPDAKAASAYGVLAPGGHYAQRWTFFIGGDGLIRRVDRDVTPKSHGSDLVQALTELGFPTR
jgi:peroxiredoxin Q/BCP